MIADESKQENIVMKYWNLDNYRFTEAIVLPNEENNSAVDRELTFQLNEKYLKRRLVAVLNLKLVRSILIKLNLKQLLQEI